VDKRLTYDAAVDREVRDVPADAVAEHAVAADAEESKTASLKDFLFLTKPGILFDNLIAAFAGFWLASGWDVDVALMIFTLIGTTLVIASSCVLNNYLDRDLDARMARTRKRALPSGRIDPKVVLWYGIALGIAGLAVLGVWVNPLSALLGFTGMLVYVWIYTVWLKRTSVWNTVIGGIAGAMPPMIGYAAVAGTLDIGAWILFAILFLWQPPHFWALGILRAEDYRKAGFRMLPAVKGAYQTKISMLRYAVLLVPTSLLLYAYGYVGEIYLFSAAALGLIWFAMCASGFAAAEESRWAKRVFVFSINYLTLLLLVMVLDTAAK
jgi:protoheme IX farnesyltransferase